MYKCKYKNSSRPQGITNLLLVKANGLLRLSPGSLKVWFKLTRMSRPLNCAEIIKMIAHKQKLTLVWFQ